MEARGAAPASRIAFMIPFVVVQDFKENPRKCTALPLSGRPGVEIVRLGRPRPGESPVELPGGILLAVDAPELRGEDRAALGEDGAVVVLDASWARLPALGTRWVTRPGARLVERSLPRGLRTAYPRRSKVHEDPPRGLATAEAMYAAAWLLGEARPDFLEPYRWARDFVRENRDVLASRTGRADA